MLIGGGRAFQVGVRWADDEEEDDDTREWKAVSDVGNGAKFCDADGDFDPDAAGIPHDVWQMAYGKIVAPLPGDDESDDDDADRAAATTSI